MSDTLPSQSTTALLAALPIPALLVGADGRVLMANTHMRDLLGSAVARGQPYVSVLRQPALVDALEATLKDATPRKTRYLAQSGSKESVYEAFCAPAAPEGSVLISFLDISDLEQAGQMRRDFVANVSHELRTPLTSLMGFIETLQGPAKDDAAARAQFLGIMASEAARMERLVSDLLSLSRVEAEERLPLRDTVELGPLLSSVRNTLAARAEEAGVTLVAELPEESIELLAHADQLLQVFTNLIENAIKYGGAGGKVVVKLRRADGQPALRGQSGALVSVTDFGAGIDPLHIPRLTERFYRVDSHRSREVGGTGLGLAIVKHIVQRHRGRLKIESELGKGTEFSVLLPLGV
ncbi:ATP-binding protein [Lentibacter sp.]|uniref:ATP-binding protein n=1 Tax=Lentibacter sp. TaxID=2024994 RepID=UPI003F6A20D9